MGNKGIEESTERVMEVVNSFPAFSIPDSNTTLADVEFKLNKHCYLELTPVRYGNSFLQGCKVILVLDDIQLTDGGERVEFDEVLPTASLPQDFAVSAGDFLGRRKEPVWGAFANVVARVAHLKITRQDSRITFELTIDKKNFVKTLKAEQFSRWLSFEVEQNEEFLDRVLMRN